MSDVTWYKLVEEYNKAKRRMWKWDMYNTYKPLPFKSKIYYQCVKPLVTYQRPEYSPRKYWRSYELVRRMRRTVTLKEHKTKAWIRQKNKDRRCWKDSFVEMAIGGARSQRWYLERKDNCLETTGRETRREGRPQLRWSDDIRSTAGLNWYEAGQNRNDWSSWKRLLAIGQKTRNFKERSKHPLRPGGPK